MYSKAYSGGMYSAFKSEGGQFSVPPRYGGVRFAKTRRNDGRDSGFERNFVTMAKDQGEAFEPSGAVADSDNSLLSGVSQEVFEGGDIIGEAPLTEGFESSPEEGVFKDITDSEAVYAEKTKSPFAELLKTVGEDDILILSIILILASEKGDRNRDIILILALLLCFR